ncbi:adenylate/guanylate cyclase domain-containing protein [Pelagibius litoralis]|uniref:Adenylate/guanylate cyclase domain-containing protein n=2 Tax=Pelagibius litoralis TaxID=374515 RepID=A0A967F293_9PROT|nr:adenylate/guanylate cyclase domain-containing protein [Pelagibius litoralis]
MSWWRKDPEAGLPERVKAAVREQENATERLISWIQLCIVITFGTLYLLSPKPQVDIAPVPWALSVYLVLTVIRVIWSHLGRLPDWSLAVSVFFDMTLLMVLIWSFHIQYMQPASFYLKAPTLLYVFIFIALRALRFDARFVLLAGVVAAIGWGLMIVYVIYYDPFDTMITRDYVAYMTSNSVLLGAEFDKIISILMVTGLIAFAIYRAKNLLVRSVSEQAAATELSRFFAPEIAKRIKGSEDQIRAGTGELRQAAILNLDMRGFTRLAGEAPPDQVMSLLSEYQQRMVPAIQRHGGSIDKFLGDGIMATFGAAEPSETYAADALRALEEAMSIAAAWQEDCKAEDRSCPSVNGAVAAGTILFGAVGDESRLEYTVIGDAVNLSAKLEKHNKDLGVRAICDRESYDRALAQGYQPRSQKKLLEAVPVGGIKDSMGLVVIAP